MAKPSAIITGVSKGFGKEIARGLLAASWHVVGDARDGDVLAGTAAELNSPDLEVLPGDICDQGHLHALVETAVAAGPLQLVINNAGTLGPSPLPRLGTVDISELRAAYETNVLAPMRLIQIALPHMTENGIFINVSSDVAVESYEGWGVYGSTKAALDALTGVLAAEVPTFRWYAFDPGDMRTDMHQAAFPDEDISDRPEPATVVPAIMHLANGAKPSGRYKAADLLTRVV